MRISRLSHLTLLALLAFACATPAWSARANKGASTFGINTIGCLPGAGPQSSTSFGAITATCFGAGSGDTVPTLFELVNNTSPYPSTLDVSISYAGAASIDYGLLTCDGTGTIPCVGAGNMVDFAGTPTFTSDGALFTFTNFSGDLAFYVNETATITSITSPTVSNSPEPRSTAAAGLLLLCAVALVRQRLARRREIAAQS